MIYEREWWRVAATFFYWGRPSFGLVMNLYFLVQNVRDYEVRPRGGGGGGPLADFTWQVGFIIAFYCNTHIRIPLGTEGEPGGLTPGLRVAATAGGRAHARRRAPA